MKKFVLGLILVLIVSLMGAFFYVINIDWNKHRDKISEQFYNSTGKHIVFVGNVSFKIFPSPYLNAINAKVYNSENKNETPILEIKNINAELSLMPLLKGEFNISKMILDGVAVNIDLDNKGLNWQGDLSADQRQLMEENNLVLNSVSLRNAVVNFKAADGDVDFNLTNLNGEVMAQSVFGPFRIEGNYLKGDTPQGFAITIGKMEDSMPTTLNAVLTHPKSSSYIRFDGTFQSDNKVLNGNVVVESQKLAEFVNDNTDKIKLDEKYNKPLILGFDLSLSKQNIGLKNVVVKYEETQGAGSIQLPAARLSNPNIKASFEFADLSLDPLVDFVKSFVAKYNEEAFNPNLNMKLVTDIRAVKATIDGQKLKNFDTSFEINSKGLLLDKFNAILPGDSAFNIKGSVYSYDSEVYYQAETSLSTDNLAQLMRWLKIEPKATASSVFKKMSLTSKISGNFDKVQISPYKVVLDGNTYSGEAGIVLGERNDLMLVVNTDTINFDNYIKSIPNEIKEKSFSDRLAYRFSKLGMFNDFDVVLNANTNLVIYEGIPFEGVQFKGNVLNGVLDIEYFNITKTVSTSINLLGKVKGFGTVPVFENMQYDIKAQDTETMVEKFDLHLPDIDYKKFNNLNATGTINGELTNFGINTVISAGNTTMNYEGVISYDDDDNMSVDGILELKNPELVSFLESINVDYKPQNPNLGLLRLKSNVKGSADALSFDNMELNVGYSQFSGNLSYDLTSERHKVDANLKINKFEADKYMLKSMNAAPLGVKMENAIAAFLSKPFWDKDRINYTPYTHYDVTGNFEIGDLSYKKYLLKDAIFKLNINNGTASVTELSAKYKNTPITATANLVMKNDPSLNVVVNIPEANVSDFSFGGRVYNVKDGKFSANISLNSKADSEQSFVDNLKGNADFIISGASVSGINIKNIYNDIVKREKSEGFVEYAKSNISSGITSFDKIVGKFTINDGVFEINEGSLTAENTNIAAKGLANIKDWTMDVDFAVAHDEPKHLQGYSFTMKNNMDNPDVSIDVSKLFDTFKAKEDQKEAEIRAKAEAERAHWATLIDEQKKISEDLAKSTKEKMNADIDEKINNAFSEDSKKMYNDVKTELSAILAGFSDSVKSVDGENGNQQNLDMLKDINTKTLQNIEKLKNKVEQIHLSDLQKQNSVEYNRIIEINNELKEVVAGYTSKVADYSSRLANIITDFKLEENESYIKAKNKIDAQIKDLEKLNSDIVTAHNLRQANGTIEEYKQLNVDMRNVLEKIKVGKEALGKDVAELDAVAVPMITQEEEAYHKKIEEEENKKLIEENTGSISVKKTGKKMMIVRDIEEIKEANEEVSNEAVRVIDFSKKTTDEKKSEASTSGGVIKKRRAYR